MKADLNYSASEAVFDSPVSQQFPAVRHPVKVSYIREMQEAITTAGQAEHATVDADTEAKEQCHVLPYFTQEEFQALCKTFNCIQLRAFDQIDYEMFYHLKKKIFNNQIPVDTESINAAGSKKFILKMQMIPIIGELK